MAYCKSCVAYVVVHSKVCFVGAITWLHVHVLKPLYSCRLEPIGCMSWSHSMAACVGAFLWLHVLEPLGLHALEPLDG